MRIVLAGALLLAGCMKLDFSRKISDEEHALRAEIRAYFDQVSLAFASANADALTGLFDGSIARPMNKEQIQAWGVKFFAEHGPARFIVEDVEFERLGHVQAVVLLRYRVKTRTGKGDFGGAERDDMVKRGGRWYITGWDVVRTPK